MVYYLIVCRSLTYAQRTAAALGRAGISAYIIRSPKGVAKEGCSHSVKIAQRNLSAAVNMLRRAGLDTSRIYIHSGNGSYQEVHA